MSRYNVIVMYCIHCSDIRQINRLNSHQHVAVATSNIIKFQKLFHSNARSAVNFTIISSLSVHQRNVQDLCPCNNITTNALTHIRYSPQFCMYFNCIIFNALSHCLGLVFCGQLLEQLSVALLSRPTVFFHCYILWANK